MRVRNVSVLSLVFCLSFPAVAQRKKQHAPTSASASSKQVVIVGEAEARAAVLNKPSAADTQLQYQEFVAKVVAGYESAITLQEAESGALTRTLLGLGPELPTRYKIHFAIDRWFRDNVDAKRYEAWRQLDIYPEYQYAIMIGTQENSAK